MGREQHNQTTNRDAPTFADHAPFKCSDPVSYEVTVSNGQGASYNAKGLTPEDACDAVNAKLPEGWSRVRWVGFVG